MSKAQFDALAAQISADLDQIQSPPPGPFINAGAYPSLQAATDEAARTRTTLYIPPGDWPITQPWLIPGITNRYEQNFFNVVGAGMIQTRIIADIEDPNSYAVQILDWHLSSMSGFSLLSVRGRENRGGIVFGGYGPDMRSGQACISLINVDGFHWGMSSSGAGHPNATCSEISFDTVVFAHNDFGFVTNHFNGLNYFFKNLLVSSNGVGVMGGTAGIFVDSGASSKNDIDFHFGNGGTGSIRNFRTEESGLFAYFGGGTDTIIEGCITSASRNPKVIDAQSTNLTLIGNLFDGYIETNSYEGNIVLLNNRIRDFDNDQVSPGMGPGFHFGQFSANMQFISVGNLNYPSHGIFKAGIGVVNYPSYTMT